MQSGANVQLYMSVCHTSKNPDDPAYGTLQIILDFPKKIDPGDQKPQIILNFLLEY